MNILKYIIASLVFVLIFKTSIGQSLSLSGTIIDGHTKEPVSYASVYFARSGVGKTSDSAGNFSFFFNNFNRDTLVVSYIGFELYKIPISTLQNNKALTIQLERGGLKNEVIIKAK